MTSVAPLRACACILTTVALLTVAGCGGSPSRQQSAPDSTTAASTPAPVGLPKGSCGELTPADVARVVPTVGDLTVRAMSAPPGSKQICGSLLITASGGLALSFTEAPGSNARALRDARALAAGQIKGRTLRQLPSLGSGAFLAGARIVGFRRRGKVVVMETGYEGGKLVLSARDLERVAGIVAERLRLRQ